MAGLINSDTVLEPVYASRREVTSVVLSVIAAVIVVVVVFTYVVLRPLSALAAQATLLGISPLQITYTIYYKLVNIIN